MPTVHYRDEGPKGAPVLLLLHGFPLSSESFAPQFRSLTRRFRVIAPDHRGFGRSPAGEGPLEMGQIARDALEVLDACGVRAAVVGGVSMGGYAAMALLREDAGRARGLVLIDTHMGADDAAGKEGREKTARSVEKDGVGVLVESMMPRLLSENASAEARRAVEDIIRGNQPKGCANALRGMALRTDSKDMLARFAGPVLIVVGEKDVITPPAKAQAMADVARGAKVVTLPGVGHLANQEAPEAVNSAIEVFLTTLAPH